AVEMLQQVVTSSRALYDIRTQAAREQSGSGRPQAGAAGSREMDLISGRIPITPEAAGAPFFFAARIAAAEQSPDPNVRARLLVEAAAERPDDSDVRKLLFTAALASRQYHLALAAYQGRGATDSAISAGMGEAYMQIGKPGDAARFFALA